MQNTHVDSSSQFFNVVGLERTATKPGLSLILIGALTLWVGAASVFYFSLPLSQDMLVWCAFGAFVVALVCVCISILFCLNTYLLLLTFLCAGVGLGCIAQLNVAQGHQAAEQSLPITELHVIQDSSTSDFGFTTLCYAKSFDGRLFKVRAFTKQSYLTGELLGAKANLQPLNANTQENLRIQGVCAQIRVQDATRITPSFPMNVLIDIRRRAIDAITVYAGNEAPLYNALVCGFRQEISNFSLYENFKTCGLAHVVAVSGAHTAIVLMLLLALLKALRVPKTLAVALSIVFIFAYVVFAGMPISAIRSALMSGLSLVSFFAKRRAAALSSIGLCIVAFITTDPSAALSVSLFLSAASTLGIMLFASLFSSWFSNVPKLVQKYIIEPSSLTAASNIATLPYSAALFSQVSVVAPIANILVTPLFALACTAGLVGVMLGLLIEPLERPAIMAASLTMVPLSGVTNMLAMVPYAAIPCSLSPVPMLVVSVVMAVLLWLVWPKPHKRIMCACIGALVVASTVFTGTLLFPKPPTLTALDVGQGDAVLLQAGHTNILVDTGNVPSKLRRELGKAGVFKLDAVIITHPDDDHCAALETLGSYVEVNRLYAAKDALRCTCSKCQNLREIASAASSNASLEPLSIGNTLQFGAFSLRVIWPQSFQDEGGNADSLCMIAEVDVDENNKPEWRALLTGDAESEQLQELIKSRVVGDIDVLKVGHHGSKVSLSSETVKVINPEIALISCGANNRYGHPSAEVLDCLNSVNCETFRTDTQGTICVTFAKDAMKLSTG